MSMDAFLRQFQEAAALPWESPPPAVSRAARVRPGVRPVPVPTLGPTEDQLLPPDVRAHALAAAADGTIVSRSLPGVDVTLTVVPPRGDALWTLRGRAWRNPTTGQPLQAVLTWGRNVLGERQVDDGGAFEFHELLLPGWAIELHLDAHCAVVLRGPTG
jgi:hypothetical protein